MKHEKMDIIQKVDVSMLYPAAVMSGLIAEPYG
jgi:hypothetical protein